VQDEMGYAIYLAQCGQKHVSAKTLKGLGSGVLRLYRTIAATPFARCTR
jgi:hypothetical protein